MRHTLLNIYIRKTGFAPDRTPYCRSGALIWAHLCNRWFKNRNSSSPNHEKSDPRRSNDQIRPTKRPQPVEGIRPAIGSPSVGCRNPVSRRKVRKLWVRRFQGRSEGDVFGMCLPLNFLTSQNDLRRLPGAKDRSRGQGSLSWIKVNQAKLSLQATGWPHLGLTPSPNGQFFPLLRARNIKNITPFGMTAASLV